MRPPDIAADPTAIGKASTPPFAKLPDPASLFEIRADRFAELATGSELAPYLTFLSELSRIQGRILADLPAPIMPEADAIERAREHGMPPLDRNRYKRDATLTATLDRLFVELDGLHQPDVARKALDALKAAPPEKLDVIIANVLIDAFPVEEMAEHVYIAAGIQVHYARMAAALDAKRLVPVGEGACPACGGPPVSSVIVGWMEAERSRFCACSTCGTLWNYVRVKCTLCASTKGISYQEVEEGAGTVKAECCSNCRSYVKILHQQTDPALDPVADDVASLALDLLMAGTDYRRGSFNPFLMGY